MGECKGCRIDVTVCRAPAFGSGNVRELKSPGVAAGARPCALKTWPPKRLAGRRPSRGDSPVSNQRTFLTRDDLLIPTGSHPTILRGDGTPLVTAKRLMAPNRALCRGGGEYLPSRGSDRGCLCGLCSGRIPTSGFRSRISLRLLVGGGLPSPTSLGLRLLQALGTQDSPRPPILVIPKLLASWRDACGLPRFLGMERACVEWGQPDA